MKAGIPRASPAAKAIPLKCAAAAARQRRRDGAPGRAQCFSNEGWRDINKAIDVYRRAADIGASPRAASAKEAAGPIHNYFRHVRTRGATSARGRSEFRLSRARDADTAVEARAQRTGPGGCDRGSSLLGAAISLASEVERRLRRGRLIMESGALGRAGF